MGSGQGYGPKQRGRKMTQRELWRVAVGGRRTGLQVPTSIARADPDSRDGSDQAWVGRQKLMAQRKSVELSNAALRAAMLRARVSSEGPNSD